MTNKQTTYVDVSEIPREDTASAIQDVVQGTTLNSAEIARINQEAEAAKAQNQVGRPLDLSAANLNLRDLGLNESDKDEIIKLSQEIGELDALAVAEYGKNISTNTNNNTSEILKLVHNKDLDETGTKLTQLVHVAKGINSSNLIGGKQSSFAKLPLIGGLFRSVDKAKTNFMDKFKSTEDQINALVGEIETNQNGLKNRVTTLNKMFDHVNLEYRELGLNIAAGHIKLQEIKNEILDLTAGSKQDKNVTQRIYDLNHIANNLEKRLHDLHVLQQSALQTLPMIRIIQANNLMLVDKFYAIKNITLPAWKNQISLAISLQEQKNSVELANTIDDATNEILKRNADLLHTNTISTAKANQRSVIDVATLEYVQNTLIKTVNEVIDIQQNGVKQRTEATNRLKALQENYENIVKADSTRIAMK